MTEGEFVAVLEAVIPGEGARWTWARERILAAARDYAAGEAERIARPANHWFPAAKTSSDGKAAS